MKIVIEKPSRLRSPSLNVMVLPRIKCYITPLIPTYFEVKSQHIAGRDNSLISYESDQL